MVAVIMKKILTLCIIYQQTKVLLGLKKRGFGMGRWNGFGGKMHDGETIEKAAHRELTEEAGIVAFDLNKLGILEFSWEGKPEILEVHIFKVNEFSGEPEESEEMKPQWFEIDQIPYELMWPDDRYWMHLFLENKKFKGRFLFGENDVVLEHNLET